MSSVKWVAVDGNEACASVAYRASEIAVIYPITPSSTMGEFADQWSFEKKPNIWGDIPEITEMQSEGGAAGAVHGAVQAGALGTTFTASQGLLLMIPNMYKIAGELTPFVMHVSARTLATHALSIFGDHSDVMACRQTGFAMLAAASVQEAQDMAAIAHAATLRSRVPFMHFFDGFRTSHEVGKIAYLGDDQLKRMIDDDLVLETRRRGLSPDHPVVRGTAQNPDTFFQAQEARNPFYAAVPGIVQAEMDRFTKITGRAYALCQYSGAPDAERVVVVMGSGAETVEQTAIKLNAMGEKVGVLHVHLFRPFPASLLVAALPKTVKAVAVLDRCKEPGSPGEPLYMDVVAALNQAQQEGRLPMAEMPKVIGGRYGLSSKEFNPGMAKAVFDELKAAAPKRSFTVGIFDDVTNLSLAFDPAFSLGTPGTKRAMFFGLGSDGTVGANKNSIKIIAENTDLFAQGYFVYDSKKSGGLTVSHLRFSPHQIRAPYLINGADFVACHHFVFFDRVDILGAAARGATLLLNAPFEPAEVWDHLPAPVQQEILDKEIKLYTIDARKVAQEADMGRRINTVMQTCFFALSGVLPRDEAIAKIKKAIQKTYGRKSQKLVEQNFAAVDATLAHLYEVPVPQVVNGRQLPPIVPDDAPDFVKRVTAMMLAGKGDLLPVSAFPVDGTWPVGTSKFEKRNIADEIPVWDPEACRECNKCTMVCPHAAIRAKLVSKEELEAVGGELKSLPYRGVEMKDGYYVLQVAPEDCTGCGICVAACRPGKIKAEPDHKALSMAEKAPILEQEKANFEAFMKLPDFDRAEIANINIKTAQLITPLFEFSGACLACGETPYIKTLTQLFGDHLMIANATGCSSIFGGNLPTTPYTCNAEGRGPAWANSLFEDNAEFGLGFRLAVDHQRALARALVTGLADRLPERLVQGILGADQDTEAGIRDQRARVADLKALLADIDDLAAKRLIEVADTLVERVIWIIGGDGWAYDIGYGGLDHVLASGRNVNILVLDTEVYSNTGGQASKSTPTGAAAKFAVGGKVRPKKDLGLMALSYGDVYTASVSYGAKDAQTVLAMQEAAAYKGVSLIVGYAHCISHGYDMACGLQRQQLAVESGYWPLYRYDPRRLGTEEPALELDAKEPTMNLADFMEAETRFRITENANPKAYPELVAQAVAHAQRRADILKRIAQG
ncbi:pyruvate:ferredoxin (flavodoxin) oxidoreductase [Oleispirillum naphthae]|uniref:pyruvate:ferredoxin (flavodoxin) oxidoreductase n=1 Tax=Oleispirillum naphthae TaxID=2838853 RepID=UPI003082447F